jgi:hypothetical protein
VVSWSTDNTGLAHDIQKWKSQKATVNPLLRELAYLLRQRSITLQVRWVPREENSLADTLSKYFDPSDWMLNPSLQRRVVSILRVKPTVDAFASSRNHHYQRWWSREREPGSAGVDFFQQPLLGEVCWMNPSFSLIGRVLAHFAQHKARGVIVVPAWPAKPWWPVFRGLLVAPPLLLPREKETFFPGVRGNKEGIKAPLFHTLAAQISSHEEDIRLARLTWGEKRFLPRDTVVRWFLSKMTRSRPGSESSTTTTTSETVCAKAEVCTTRMKAS